MLKWFLLVILFCSLFFISYGTSDSLKLINKIAAIERLIYINLDSALIKSKELEKESGLTDYTEIRWEALILKGRSFNGLGKKDSSLLVFNKLLDEVSKVNNRIFLIKTYTKLADVYNNNYDFEKTIKYLVDAEKLLNSSDSFSLGFNIQHVKASSHRRMKNYENAIKIYESLIENSFNQMENPQKFHVFNGLGTIKANQKEYDEAEIYFSQAYDICKNEENLNNIALITYNLGGIYLRQKKYKLAEEYISKALKSNISTNNILKIEYCYRVLGVIQLDLKNYNKAITYHLKALEIAKKIDNPRSILGNYRNLYLTYGHQAELSDSKELLKKELNYFKKWSYLKDSLYQVDMAEKILTLEKEFETEKKNNQINLLEKDNKLKESTIKTQQTQQTSLLIIVGLAIMAIVIFVYWYIYYKRINKVLQTQSKRILEQNEEISTKNDKLQKAINTRNKLFSIIAHDLRSPLTSIANFSKLINFYLKDNKLESVHRMSHEMQKKNSYILELTDNLLSWTKSQSEELIPQFEKTSICEVVEECVDIYKAVAKDKEITILSKEYEDCLIWSDRNMLKTIIRNLINNAIKFTNPEGLIEISYIAKEDFIELLIKDNGIGMSKKEAQDLFITDNRIIKTGTQNEKSTGLGLSVCKEFTQVLEGQIYAKSEEDKGTQIFLRLPIYRNQDKHIKVKTPEVEFQDSLN